MKRLEQCKILSKSENYTREESDDDSSEIMGAKDEVEDLKNESARALKEPRVSAFTKFKGRICVAQVISKGETGWRISGGCV